MFFAWGVITILSELVVLRSVVRELVDRTIAFPSRGLLKVFSLLHLMANFIAFVALEMALMHEKGSSPVEYDRYFIFLEAKFVIVLPLFYVVRKLEWLNDKHLQKDDDYLQVLYFQTRTSMTSVA